MFLKTVLQIRVQLNPFHFGLPEPDLNPNHGSVFHEADLRIRIHIKIKRTRNTGWKLHHDKICVGHQSNQLSTSISFGLATPNSITKVHRVRAHWENAAYWVLEGRRRHWCSSWDISDMISLHINIWKRSRDKLSARLCNCAQCQRDQQRETIFLL